MWFKRTPRVNQEIKEDVAALLLATDKQEAGWPSVRLIGLISLAWKTPEILSEADLDYLVEQMTELTGPYQPEFKAKECKIILIGAKRLRQERFGR